MYRYVEIMNNVKDMMARPLSGEKGFKDDEKRELFNRLWQKHGRKIAYFISQTAPSETEHFEDLYQDVMMQVYIHLSEYDRALPFEAWAYRIARNRCIDHLRGRRSIEGLNDSMPHKADSIEETFIRSELDTTIRKALDSLEPADRQIAFLRFFENMRHRQIASIMEMNENTVKTRVAAVKRILRAELGGWK